MTLLKKEDHGCTRKLWEEVFDEDSAVFLDYYYKHMADHNQIFVQEKDGDVISMVHLNPYQILCGGEKTTADYIVAVATREAFRHQGRMRALLLEAFDEMYRKKQPFTFLMPAAEAIYEPFDFVTVYHQNRMTLEKDTNPEKDTWDCRSFREEDMESLLCFSNALLKKRTGSYTERLESYYRRIQKEQKAMNGTILLFWQDETLMGYCFSGCEGETEVWELAVEQGEEKRALHSLAVYFKDALPLHVSGFLPEGEMEGIPYTYRPLTMIRIIHLEEMFSLLRKDTEERHEREEELVSFTVKIQDPLIQRNCGAFQVCVGTEETKVIRLLEDTSAEEMSIEELTQVLFLGKEGSVIPIKRLRRCSPVFFNEIV